jgi:hypothetical protein
VYSEDVNTDYAITYDTTKSIEILEENCYKGDDGFWYTKDTPAAYQKTRGAEVDADAVHSGWNVKLRGWKIDVPTGWSDVVCATSEWAAAFNAIDIPCTMNEVAFYSPFADRIVASTFEMVMHCCGPHLVNVPIEMFRGQTGVRQWNRNVSAWQGANAEAFYKEFTEYETKAPADKAASAEKLQMLYASDLPSIPTHANIFFYNVRETYFTGWCNGENYFQQPQNAFTINQIAAKCRLYLNLQPTGAAAPGIPWTGLIMTIMVMAIVLPIAIRRKMRSKKN